MKKFCATFILFFLLVFSFSKPTFAEEACSSYPTEELKRKCEDIESQIREYEAKLAAAQETESALKKNIEYYDNQIYLAKLRISESEIIIEKRKQDIEDLTNKIIILEDRLDKNTKLFLKRINLSYRKGEFKPYMIFFGNGTLSEKASRYKYLQMVQSADRKFLVRVQETKNSYNDQKKLVAAEKKALEAENVILEQRKAEYNKQVEEKQLALADTQNEEQVLSAQIENLKAQRSNLMGGISSVITSYECQTWTEDDNYFNQADCRWGNVIIGNANYADDSFMWKYGCAVTSVSMILKKSGASVNPQTIAQNSDFFAKSGEYQTDLIIWDKPAAAYGKSLRWLSGWGDVDQKLSEGKWVIVHVGIGGYGYGHYVVLKSKEGDDYKMHDPYFGNNLMFHSRYSGADQMLTYE